MSSNKPNSGQDIHLGGREIVSLQSAYVLNCDAFRPVARILATGSMAATSCDCVVSMAAVQNRSSVPAYVIASRAVFCGFAQCMILSSRRDQENVDKPGPATELAKSAAKWFSACGKHGCKSRCRQSSLKFIMATGICRDRVAAMAVV